MLAQLSDARHEKTYNTKTDQTKQWSAPTRHVAKVQNAECRKSTMGKRQNDSANYPLPIFHILHFTPGLTCHHAAQNKAKQSETEKRMQGTHYRKCPSMAGTRSERSYQYILRVNWTDSGVPSLYIQLRRHWTPSIAHHFLRLILYGVLAVVFDIMLP